MSHSLLALFFFVLVTSSYGLQEQEEVNYRLPVEVVPLLYDIQIEPNFDDEVFYGFIVIEVRAVSDGNNITLHQANLTLPPKDEILIQHLTSGRYLRIKSAGSTGTLLQNFYRIVLEESLIKGNKYRIIIPNYSGAFNTQAQGLYLAKYTDEDGSQKVFATTQFEPTLARTAFPCFDEPHLKAYFTIRLFKPPGYSSVSNNPRSESLSTDNMDVYVFSHLMSTYLVAFIISQMEFSETMDRHRVLAIPKDIRDGKHIYGLQKANDTLFIMEDYIRTPYSLEKLDHALIPNDYVMQFTMESWGLVTYKYSAFEVSEESTYHERFLAYTVVSYQITHQWFGNLVTPNWWDVKWLNEGFANYFKYVLSEAAEPDLNMGAQVLSRCVHPALDFDGNENVRPMTSPTSNPAQISSDFDTIGYSKSGAVIRMLEHAIGSATFKRGLQYYVTDRAFKSAVPSDLYKNVQRAVDEESSLPSDINVQDFMTSWEFAAGVPVVTITRNYDSTNRVTLTQKRFYNDRSSQENGSWIIPINFVIKSNPQFTDTAPDMWLTNAETSTVISGLTDGDWLIANKLQTGYYRINYDVTNWKLITDALLTDHLQIDAVNRAQLIDDCSALGKSQNMPMEVCNELLKYISNEKDPIPLAAYWENIDWLYNKVVFQEQLLRNLRGIVNRFTFDEKETDKPADKFIRSQAIYWLCKMGDSQCNLESVKKFNRWSSGKEALPADLQAVTFCSAIRQGNLNNFFYLFSQLKASSDSKLHKRFSAGLACTENKQLLQFLLDYGANSNSKYLMTTILESMSQSSGVGLEMVLEFVDRNFDQMETLLEKQGECVLKNIPRYITTENQFEKLEKVVLRTGKKSLENALETARSNLNWLLNN